MKCEYCDKEAMLETPVAGIFICESNSCKIMFCEDQCYLIEED